MKNASSEFLWVARCLLGAACLLGCGTNAPDQKELVARGYELFNSRALSSSGLNLFACSTCHDERAPGPTITKTGALLAGVTERPSFWGGQEDDLLLAIDDCRNEFMAASVPLEPKNADADALYAFLASLEPGNAAAVPFRVVREIDDIPRGDATRGQATYAKACRQCHGAIHTGYGSLGDVVPILPDDTLAAHPPPAYSPRTQRLVFIEKTRHGVFLNYGGQMPPFSAEVLPDADLSDVLEALGVTGE
jgi:thiosulfate dehydrogenase